MNGDADPVLPTFDLVEPAPSVARPGAAPLDGFYRIDGSWRIVELNAIAAFYFATPESEAVGRTLWELAPGLLGTECETHYRQALADRTPTEFVGPSARHEGRWLEARIFPEHDGLAVYLRDVTERMTLEASLQALVDERTAELDALYQRTPTLLHSQSPEGRLISVSDRWLEFMGYDSRDEVIGRPIRDFMTAASIERHLSEHWPRLLAEGGFDDVEYEAVKKNGEIAQVLVSSRIWHDSQGRFARTMAALVDITGKRKTEEALRQSQKVEAMGQLTGGVAHDFNNLLSPIIGGLDLLQRRGVGDARDQRIIEGALQAAERARTLVQRLLAFARRQPLQPTAVDLSALVEGMADLIESTLGPRVRIVLDVARPLPAVHADANQIEMALLNLCLNARDAMPDGGILALSAAQAELAGDNRLGLPPGRYVALSVEDNGVGMPEETLKRAIEPFFSTKGLGRGTGLGLSMVHGLAAQLGGALWLESSPGAGTRAEIWLREAEVQPEGRQAGARTETPRASGVALLVDDEELVRGSTAAMLEELGYRVVQADNATEALAWLHQGLSADIVVTDHLMPGVTGVELALRLRELDPELPVLIVSGYAEVEGLDGAFARLAKPFRQEELADCLALLRRAQPVAEGAVSN
ncbi:MAG: PAS domain-containing protein [Allosphingosinicella sp.]|uniref:hybrid sensor histidine kinase/response regulator n=1 Tax=Allosphingosinicella sp. TaxID=2823234 RepID=UPI0039342C36